MDDEALSYGSYKKIKLSMSGCSGGEIVKFKANNSSPSVCIQRSKGVYAWEPLSSVFAEDLEDIECDWDALDLALGEVQRELDTTHANLKNKQNQLAGAPLVPLSSFASHYESVRAVLAHRNGFKAKIERITVIHDEIKRLNEKHVATFAERGKRMTPWT